MSDTDPTAPALLSAADIAAMRLRDSGEDAAEAIADHDQPTIDRAALLAHLAALQAPAPDDGGEALGRGLYERGRSISMSGAQVVPWECLTDNMKSEHIENAIALDAAGYARGFAAGRGEGEAERGQLAADLTMVTRRCEEFSGEASHARAEIARLTAAFESGRLHSAGLIAMGVQDAAEIVGLRRNNERLTAELAEARRQRDEHEEARRVWCSRANAMANILGREEGDFDFAGTATKALAAARLDGAREERDYLMGHDTAYPLLDVLLRLADAADHLLTDHGCDSHGWEVVGGARDGAREIARRIRTRGEGRHG